MHMLRCGDGWTAEVACKMAHLEAIVRRPVIWNELTCGR